MIDTSGRRLTAALAAAVTVAACTPAGGPGGTGGGMNGGMRATGGSGTTDGDQHDAEKQARPRLGLDQMLMEGRVDP